MKLLDLPKDLLIKLIVTVENTIKTSLQSSYQKVYYRQEKIYEGINKVFLVEWIRVYRCDFQGCREVEVDSSGQTKGKLNSCSFFRTGRPDLHYCDAHDKINYMKEIDDHDNEDIFSVCEYCKIDELERGCILTEKDLKYVDKEKVRRQLEEDNIRKEKEKDKVPIYYTLSRDQLNETLFNIGVKTKEWYEEEHNKELLLIEDIMKKIGEIAGESFKIHNCKFKGCENFKIR